MKKNAKALLIRLSMFLLFAAASIPAGSLPACAASPKIGDSIAGGIVFYVDNTGQHGMVAAPADIKDNTAGQEKAFFSWYSARVAANTFAGGYCDWFLPNREQLKELYRNRDAVGGLEATYYWSSSESEQGQAWAQDFSTGEQLTGNKTNTSRVRPPRYF